MYVEEIGGRRILKKIDAKKYEKIHNEIIEMAFAQSVSFVRVRVRLVSRAFVCGGVHEWCCF